MIHQKDGGQVGKTISHYKILEKLGEGVGSILATQIDEISKEISRDLGIAQRKIAETQRPVAAVTTTSLEAYNNFILGRDAKSKFYHNDAIRYLAKSVALDSTFAIAHLHLSFYRAQHRELAKKFSYKATKKDQLYIEAFLADSPEKRLSMMQEYVRKYPKEKRGLLTLAVYYHRLEWNISWIKKAPAGAYFFGLAALYHDFSGSRKQAFRDLVRASQVADSTGWEFLRNYIEGIKFWIYYDQDNLESARTAYRIYSEWYNEKRHPSSVFKVYNNACLGFVSVKDGKVDSAAYYLDNVASLLLESSQRRIRAVNKNRSPKQRSTHDQSNISLQTG